MLSRSEGVPSNFGVQVLDRFKMGVCSLGDNAEVGVTRKVNLNLIEFDWRVIIFICEGKSIFLWVGEN